MANVDIAARTKALLEELWQKHKGSIFERVDLLRQLADGAALGPLSEGQREEGRTLSHKLAGSLGTFGHKEATQWARELERLYEQPSLTAEELSLLKTNLDELLRCIPPR